MNEFAEEILFGETLASKLIERRGAWTDSSARIALPIHPGRPQHLKPVVRRQGRFDFPKIASFADPKQRGKALHYFANHELEALELMAMALLKFQDAPKNYRLALAGIISEEQRHLKLYLNRMRALGVEFGDYPVSGFFWQSLSRIDDLKKFTAAMNLTLEQANLDHCIYFRELFYKVGDSESSQIMDQVLRDEIGHVRHGLNWFNKWKPEDATLWNSYLAELPPGLNAARARGRAFSRDLRSEIGFDKDFIDNLEIHAQSRGRVPDLYYFYPFVEYELALGPHGINIPQKMYDLKTDLETLPMFLAKADDMVLVTERPRREFLQQIKSAGFEIPEFAILSEELKSAKRRIREFKPWGWCYHTKKVAKEVSSHLDVACPESRGISFFNELYAKDLALKILTDNSDLCDEKIIGKLCTDEDSVYKCIKDFTNEGYKNIAIKGMLGSSGQNQIKYTGEFDSRQVAWLKRLLREQGKVIVEPWLDRVFDFSLQVRMLPDGKIKFLGYSRFICDEAGKYRGTWLGGFESALTKEQVVFIHKNQLLKELSKKIISAVETELKARNYVGVAGIDCFAYRDPNGELKIKPLVEVNVRSNMGEVTVKLNSRLVSRKTGIWMIISRQELPKLGFESFSQWAKYCKEKYPLKLDKSNLLESGVLFTNDPETAKSYCGVMAVGLEDFVNKLSSAALKLG